MGQIAKIFLNGRSQAVRLPAAYRFHGSEVYIRHDPATGDVILSERPKDWTGLLASLQNLNIDADFLSSTERAQDVGAARPDPFEGWQD